MQVTTPHNYDTLSARLQSASISVDPKRLHDAWEIAMKAYGEKEHWTGVSTMTHVLGILETLLPLKPDEESILACLLHHVLQCKYCTVTELEQHFGAKTRELVSSVHLLSHVTIHDRRVSVDDLKLMLLTVSNDVRAIVLILCDRLTILRDLHHVEQRRHTAQDVLQLFAPVAARLGMYALKHQLEEEAFPLCYPQDAERIAEQVQQVQHRYGAFMERTAKAVKESLECEGISCTIEARVKHPYSVFRKMQEKGLTHVFDLYDYYAIRVITSDSASCYQALGVLHKIGRPVGNRFKDYIAFPKPNGYRSLHTTLARLPAVPSDSVLIEVQIRTAEMHRESMYGVAAHWMYKERGATARAVAQIQLHDMLTLSLTDHIFVLTPKGDVIELPEGATPLDLAFQVHTDLGLAFRGARVNGSIVPMDYQLENGDIVEILKQSNPQPSPQWLCLLKMASSKSKLKRYLNAQQRPELIVRGREVLNEELMKHRLPPLDTGLSALRSVGGVSLTVQEREDLLMKVGQGAERPSSVLPKLDAFHAAEHMRQHAKVLPWIKDTQKKSALSIEGGIPLPNRFAKCCYPQEWPKESMKGVVSRNRGEIVVHRASCGMLRNANPDRVIRLWWEE